MTFAPNVFSSSSCAAVAARAARLFQPHDPALANAYADSAEKVWTWAEVNLSKSNGAGYQPTSLEDLGNIAAAELLLLTRDAKFDTVEKETTKGRKDGWIVDQLGGAFTLRPASRRPRRRRPQTRRKDQDPRPIATPPYKTAAAVPSA